MIAPLVGALGGTATIGVAEVVTVGSPTAVTPTAQGAAGAIRIIAAYRQAYPGSGVSFTDAWSEGKLHLLFGREIDFPARLRDARALVSGLMEASAAAAPHRGPLARRDEENKSIAQPALAKIAQTRLGPPTGPHSPNNDRTDYPELFPTLPQMPETVSTPAESRGVDLRFGIPASKMGTDSREKFHAPLLVLWPPPMRTPEQVDEYIRELPPKGRDLPSHDDIDRYIRERDRHQPPGGAQPGQLSSQQVNLAPIAPTYFAEKTNEPGDTDSNVEQPQEDQDSPGAAYAVADNVRPTPGLHARLQQAREKQRNRVVPDESPGSAYAVAENVRPQPTLLERLAKSRGGSES